MPQTVKTIDDILSWAPDATSSNMETVAQTQAQEQVAPQTKFETVDDIVNYNLDEGRPMDPELDPVDRADPNFMGPKFSPEEVEQAKGVGYTLATAGQRFANAAAFNLPRNLGAAGDAFIEAVQTGDFSQVKKDFKKFRNQSIVREELGREATPTIGFLSEGLGYIRNPAGAIARGAGFLKGAANAAAIAAPTNAVNAISRIAAGEDANQVINEEVENVAINAALGGTINKAVPYLFKPLATAGKGLVKIGDFIYKKTKSKLSPEGVKLIEAFEDIVGFKGNKEQLLKDTQQKIADAYEQVGQTFEQEIQAAGQEANGLADDLLLKGQQEFNKAGEDFIQAIQSKNPKAIVENMGKAADIVHRMDETVSHNYQVEFDDIAKNVKVPVQLDEALDAFKNDLKGSKDIIFDEKGLIKTEGKTYVQNKKGIDFLNNVFKRKKGTKVYKADLATDEVATEIPEFISPKGKPGMSIENVGTDNAYKAAVYRDKNGKVLGFRTYNLPDKGTTGIKGVDTLFVKPEARGQGIATKITDYVKQNGFPDIDKYIAEAPKTEAGAAFANKYLNKGGVSFQEAGNLGKVIGKATNWQKLAAGEGSVEDHALANLYRNISDTLDNPEKYGKAVERYKPLKTAYQRWLEVSGKIKTKAGVLRTAAASKEMDNSYLSNINSAVKALEYVKNESEGIANIVTKMSPEQTQGLNAALEDARRTVDIRTIAKADKAVSTLKGIIDKGPDAVDTNIIKVKGLLDDYSSVERAKDAIQKMDVANVIKEAAADPLNAAKVARANKYFDDYVGTDKKQLQSFLNRAAHGQRLLNIKDKGAAQIVNQIKLGKTMLPEETAVLELSAKMDPTVTKLIQDADLLEALVKENPSIMSPEALARVTAGGVVLGPAMLAVAAIPTLMRNIENPTALILLLKKAGVKQKYSDQAILKAAQVVNSLSKAVYFKDDTQTQYSEEESGKYDPVYGENKRYQ